jgi:Uma2 family endonuclease
VDTISKTNYNDKELMEISGRGRYELVKGVLHEMSPSGKRHGLITSKLHYLLASYVYSKKLGQLTAAETGFKISTNPDTVKAPDIAFISNEKLKEDDNLDGYSMVMPELVVEVNSPYDVYNEIIDKVNDWLQAGVKEVWVVEPKSKTVVIHNINKVRILKSYEELTSEAILPEFKCKVWEIFDI